MIVVKMKFIFWIISILIIFIYVGYPIVLNMIFLFRKKRYVKEEFFPKVSILIPAYNEEKVIAQKLTNCFNLDYPHDYLEMILILDNCTDNTKEIALRYKDKNLKIIEQKVRSGKIAALNEAVPQAKGEILIFTDTNAIFKKDAIKKLVRYFKDKNVGGVCGRLIFKSKMESSSFEAEGLYWRYEDFIKRKESEVGSLVTANGSIYAVDKSLYSKIDDDLADDLVIPIVVASKKKRFIYEPDAIAQEKLPQKAEEEFYRRVRIINQGFKTTFRLTKSIMHTGNLFVFEFLFHKLLRWFVPIFLIFVFISNLSLLESKLFLLFFIIQLIFYVMAFWGYVLNKRNKRVKIFYLPFYFCLLNLAALCGFFNFLSKAQSKIWDKAETTR